MKKSLSWSLVLLTSFWWKYFTYEKISTFSTRPVRIYQWFVYEVNRGDHNCDVTHGAFFRTTCPLSKGNEIHKKNEKVDEKDTVALRKY